MKSRATGRSRTRVVSSQRSDAVVSRRARARAAIAVVAQAARVAKRVTPTAIRPRPTQPNTSTGVKVSPTMAAGAIAGRSTCFRSTRAGGKALVTAMPYKIGWRS